MAKNHVLGKQCVFNEPKGLTGTSTTTMYRKPIGEPTLQGARSTKSNSCKFHICRNNHKYAKLHGARSIDTPFNNRYALEHVPSTPKTPQNDHFQWENPWLLGTTILRNPHINMSIRIKRKAKLCGPRVCLNPCISSKASPQMT